MWIMLITKLGTEPSPPKLSIFWSTPWTDTKYSRKQVEQWLEEEDLPRDFFLDEEGRELSKDALLQKATVIVAQKTVYMNGAWGPEHNWAGARKIHYKDTDIRVFPNEFSIMTDEKMAFYAGLQDGASHELMPSSVADATLIQEVLSGSLKEIFDAAKVDGATDEQARAMAFGVDVSGLPQVATLPPIGWYRCRREYAEIYCDEWEMKG